MEGSVMRTIKLPKIFLIAILLVVLNGCATKISDRAAKIQVHHQMSTLLSNCKKLGPVSSPSTEWTPTLRPDMAGLDAEAKARDAVAELGGDTLVIINTDLYNGDFVGKSSKAVVQGMAMKCY